MSGYRAIVLALFAVVGLGAGIALAQYPPPAGSGITVTPQNPNPPVGSNVQVTVVVREGTGSQIVSGGSQGQVLAALPTAYTATVSGGSGATVSPASGTTDAQGRATLTVFTGTVAATLTVKVTTPAGLTGQATLFVGTAPAPPATGNAGFTEGSSFPTLPVAALGAVAVLAIGGGAGLYLRRR